MTDQIEKTSAVLYPLAESKTTRTVLLYKTVCYLERVRGERRSAPTPSHSSQLQLQENLAKPCTCAGRYDESAFNWRVGMYVTTDRQAMA
jgi:hypothetical protein